MTIIYERCCNGFRQTIRDENIKSSTNNMQKIYDVLSKLPSDPKIIQKIGDDYIMVYEHNDKIILKNYYKYRNEKFFQQVLATIKNYPPSVRIKKINHKGIAAILGGGIVLVSVTLSMFHQPSSLQKNSNSQKILNSGKIMSNGDELVVLNNINIKAVPAYNITPEHLQFHPKGRDNGYVLTLDNMKIYIAGDTENIDEMNNLKDIDIAFLPVNQPYTMTIEQANLATKMINPKILYPYHYGNTKIEELSKLLKDSNIDVRIRNME